nr:hypothetical protein [uncultured Dysosmobacter sp.]
MEKRHIVGAGKGAILDVDGGQVFAAWWVMEQMAAQTASIDRANRIAAIALVVSVFSVILSAILL